MIIQPMSDTASASFTATRLNGICPLPHLGVIRARGEDAARFLQGQLTQDVQHLPPGQARLAALCNPKGRMLASFWVLRRADDELLLITSADTLAATLKRLSMFVLRARLKLSDATSELALRGLIGDATISIAAGANQTSADSQNDAVSTIPLPAADGAPRALWLGPVGTPAPAAASLSSADWLAAEVRAGVARVTQPVVEAFVPQMLNYESVDGVHFQKGCYPGQEVVARSQYRGTTKRRAFIVHADQPLMPGQELFSEADPGQPAGVVINVAPIPGAAPRSSALVELKLAARGTALRAGSAEGPAVQLGSLPYSLPSDDASE